MAKESKESKEKEYPNLIDIRPTRLKELGHEIESKYIYENVNIYV
jgi:hypothetical protein